MRLLKISGMLAALALSWGCGGEGNGEPIPNDVASVINESCGDCHGNPTANDAPMPIIDCDDVLAAAPSNSSIRVLDEMENRINDASNPMPPTGQLAAGPLATLNDWIDDGAPPCE